MRLNYSSIYHFLRIMFRVFFPGGNNEGLPYEQKSCLNYILMNTSSSLGRKQSFRLQGEHPWLLIGPLSLPHFSGQVLLLFLGVKMNLKNKRLLCFIFHVLVLHHEEGRKLKEAGGR